jgi:hypothetical protein
MIDQKHNLLTGDTFTNLNYPKTYGSIQKGTYRLGAYLYCLPDELENIEHYLWKFVTRTARTKRPVIDYENFQFIRAGWEWSVFQRDDKTVIKIPAGIFPEICDPQYLKNTEFSYHQLLRFFPKHFVANTSFARNKNANVQLQEFVFGDVNVVNGHGTSYRLRLNLIDFARSALEMLAAWNWLPDFDIRKSQDGFTLRNVMFAGDTPKIIDFTSYYDAFRLYPARTTSQVLYTKQLIQELLEFLTRS